MARLAKETLKQVLMKTIDDLSEEDWARIEHAEAPADAAQLLFDFVNRAFIQTHWVVCALPYNAERIDEADAIQCLNCGKYFCLDHNLEYCAECGQTL